MSIKILTIVGARPQFIKSSAVSSALKNYPEIEEIFLHTGQHFDNNMSDIFFEQLNLPKPDIKLNVNGGSHGEMTGKMLFEIEKAIVFSNPSRVLVYGDTNSTLAGTLAAAKLNIPIAHVEAGLRSFNTKMPEEINRLLVDQMSDILFCPTNNAVQNLIDEGQNKKQKLILNVGDVMLDAIKQFQKYSIKPTKNISNDFILATLHRAENTDNPKKLIEIISALNLIHKEIATVILPLHPRTKKKIADLGLQLLVEQIEPIGYLEMLWFISNSKLVITDSGGLQKEAFFVGKFCITLRDETEWVELVELGANILTGSNKNKIIKATRMNFERSVENKNSIFGEVSASDKIASTIFQEEINAL